MENNNETKAESLLEGVISRLENKSSNLFSRLNPILTEAKPKESLEGISISNFLGRLNSIENRLTEILDRLQV